MKAYQKLKKSQGVNNNQFNKVLIQNVKEEQQTNKLEYLMLAKQVSALCDQVEDSGIAAQEEM